MNRVDLMRSNFFINLAEFYFQLFIEKFQLEAQSYYLGMENFFYQIKHKEIENRINSFEDIEDTLYRNAIKFANSISPMQFSFTQGKYKIYVVDENNYNVFENSYWNNPNIHDDNNMDLEDIDMQGNDINTTINDNRSITKSNQVFEIKKMAKRVAQIASFNKEKVKIPFLKQFNPRSIKREEIDKKIIRKFKKFLKEKIREKYAKDYFLDNIFWKDFTAKNLLPPIVYTCNNEEIQFKSFNSNYIAWLFSQIEAKTLYNLFLNEKKNELFESLKKMIKIPLTEDIIIELTNIYDYVLNFGEIYGRGIVFKNSNKFYQEEKIEENYNFSTKKEDMFSFSQDEHFEVENTNFGASETSKIFTKTDQEEKEIGDSCCFQELDFFKK